MNDWLAGGGEMGERMRRLDWSATSLGPLSAWPQSLRTAVSIMLGCQYPLLIWWGPRLTHFYNDAYIPVLGRRHPEALGRPAPEVWSEAWPLVGPQADAVLSEGRSHWNEELLIVMTRNGAPEEVFMTFSYGPIRDDAGRVGGVFCACTEETPRVLGRRRLATLRSLADRSSRARTPEEACTTTAAELALGPSDVPFALLYLLDADGRTARLAGETGLPSGGAANPPAIEMAHADAPWPLAEVAAAGTPRDSTGLVERFGPLPGGPWPEPTRQAVTLPLAGSGQAQLAGFLVVGVSPRLPLDDGYRSFLELVAGQAAAAIANARAHETERRRAEALAEIDRAKTAFFSNVSHEFRTPLALMLGPLEGLLAKPGLAPDVRDELELVRRNGARLLRLVNTLLDFSRVEAGRMQASFEPVDLAMVTADLASTFRSVCESAGLVLAVDCPPLPRLVHVDLGLWEQVVLNLVSNAFKFTHAGRIEVTVREEAGGALVAVRDTGIGIAADDLPRVFDRFHRVAAGRGRSHEGSGIGLALVRELVAMHGGSIAVESALDRGSTFRVHLPYGTAHLPHEHLHGAVASAESRNGGSRTFADEASRWLPAADAMPPRVALAADDATAADESTGNRRSVLLVDDNADMRDYVRRLLEPAYDVRTAADGQSALDDVRRATPDLVLADVMMPRLDGFALLKALRGDRRWFDLPVILLSARAGEESRIEGLEAGATDYLVKPFAARELLARVASILENSQLRRRADDALRASVALTETSTDVLYRMSPDWSEMRQLSGVGFLADSHGGARDWMTAYIPLDEQARVHAAIDVAVAGKTLFELEHRVLRADGTPGWTASRAVPVLDGRGEIREWFGAASDITGRREAEERLRSNEAQLRVMVAELQHRTRNLLTVVGGIAEQALSTSGSLASFGAGFERRLAALGRVQGLLTRDAVVGTGLRELVFLELDAHGLSFEASRERVTVDGPDVLLGPREVQLMALGLHELTTNAVKHGALGHGGRLAIGWRIDGASTAEGRGRLRLDWVERAVPRGPGEPGAGFGRHLIESTLPYELDAETTLSFTDDGVRCSIALELDGRDER